MNSHLMLMFTKHVHPAFGIIIIINIMDAIFLVPSLLTLCQTLFFTSHTLSLIFASIL